ncbi:MAG: ribosomal protein S18-alanine N-acetyltransferase [Clostridia bacterium]|nr:ribosomal protein S18-alanine N-acetyltransferase [Clostridia bacterium]MBR2973822.1 ribosomal protein S18-alanine N-acetyltransferase [Clostridia bacterium]
MIILDTLKPEYIPQVAEIEKACFSLPWSEDAFMSELDNPLATYIVAVEEETVLGFAGVHIIAGEGYITNIAVSETARRCGIGEMMLCRIIDICRDKCTFVTLEVRVSNTSAISLYEKLGFETLGIRKNFYEKPTEDAVIMTLTFKDGNNDAV